MRVIGRHHSVVVVVLDDLQWADAMTLGWLETLTRVQLLSERRLLILGLYRDEECSEELDALRRAETVLDVPLGRLEAHHTRAIIASMLGFETAPKDHAEALHLATDGNPFFVAEYLRDAVTQELFPRDAPGRWSVSSTTHTPLINLSKQPSSEDPLHLPTHIRALLEKRADQLAQIRRHLRIRALLEVWLFIHIPATIALLAALLAHVVSVFFYW